MLIDTRSTTEINTDLGKTVSTHPTAAVFVQRAAIVAMVSFVFFLLMLVGFSIRQHFGYFLLASAFLVVYLFTMLGWWTQKRNVLTIYEHGVSYRKFKSRWEAISSFEENVDPKGSRSLTLTDQKRRTVIIPATIDNIERVAEIIRAKVAK